MPQGLEIRILVHPSDSNSEFPDPHVRAREVWKSWGWAEKRVQWITGAEGQTRILHGLDSLENTHYLDDLPSGTRITIGGQVTGVCVSIHVEHIITHPRAKDYAIVFDRQALIGSDEGVDHLVELLQEHGISAVVQEE